MLSEQRLIRGIAAAKSKEADSLICEVDLGANQAMSPVRVDGKTMTEEQGEPVVIGATDKNDCAGGMSLQIKHEVRRKGSTEGSAFGASCVTNGGSGEPSIRRRLKGVDRSRIKALPDLRLPATVEAFDGILKARLARRSEDRDHAKAQACADHSTNRIRAVMRTLENQRIVELCIRGKTKLPPAAEEQFDNVDGTDREAWPTGGNASMNGTLSSLPPRNTRPSMVSNESSSLLTAATAGRYQPTGGGGRRMRVRPSRMPRLWRMRPMVRREGTGASCWSIIAERMASAPTSPRSLLANLPRKRRTCSSVAMLTRLIGFGEPAGRALQSTRSSRLVDARSTHR
jgi:hypothetical protein